MADVAELIFFTGPMDCGKSTLALQVAYTENSAGRQGRLYTRLDRADFREALRFGIDPARNSLKKARFSREALSGLLLTFGISID